VLGRGENGLELLEVRWKGLKEGRFREGARMNKKNPIANGPRTNPRSKKGTPPPPQAHMSQRRYRRRGAGTKSKRVWTTVRSGGPEGLESEKGR